MVAAALSGARDKAHVAAGLQSDAAIYHSVGYQLAGEWKFGDCAGGAAVDTSGSNNTGTLIGSPSWSTDTPNNQGCSLVFSGGQSVSVSTGPQLTYKPITMSAWVKEPSSTYGTFIIGKSRYGGFLRDFGNSTFEWDIYDGTAEHNLFAPIPSFNKWHFIVGVYDGATQSLYVDGTLQSSASLNVTPVTTSDLGIGECIFCGNQFVTGQIDEVRIYNSTLVATDIERLYASGAARHDIARE